jgi:hypothetical protein
METCGTEEPDEGKPHVRICGGASWVTTGSTRTPDCLQLTLPAAAERQRSAARGLSRQIPMTNDEYVSLKQLAEVLGMDRSGCRRYLLKEGFKPVKRRTLDSGGQLALSYTKEEADRIIALR